VGEGITESEKKCLVVHFGDTRFVEALIKLVSQVRATSASAFVASPKSDFESEALVLIVAKSECGAIDRIVRELRQLHEVAIEQCPVQPNQA
jgi:hypothetical protein